MIFGLKDKLLEAAKNKVVEVTSQFISINPLEQNLLLKWPAITFLINKSLKNNELIANITFSKNEFQKVRIELQDESLILLKVESISIKNYYDDLDLEIKLLSDLDITNIDVIKQFGLSCMGILTGKGSVDTSAMKNDSINYNQKQKTITLPINKKFSSKGILSKIKDGSEATASFTSGGLQIDYPEGTNLTSIFKMVG